MITAEVQPDISQNYIMFNQIQSFVKFPVMLQKIRNTNKVQAWVARDVMHLQFRNLFSHILDTSQSINCKDCLNVKAINKNSKFCFQKHVSESFFMTDFLEMYFSSFPMSKRYLDLSMFANIMSDFAAVVRKHGVQRNSFYWMNIIAQLVNIRVGDTSENLTMDFFKSQQSYWNFLRRTPIFSSSATPLTGVYPLTTREVVKNIKGLADSFQPYFFPTVKSDAVLKFVLTDNITGNCSLIKLLLRGDTYHSVSHITREIPILNTDLPIDIAFPRQIRVINKNTQVQIAFVHTPCNECNCTETFLNYSLINSEDQNHHKLEGEWYLLKGWSPVYELSYFRYKRCKEWRLEKIPGQFEKQKSWLEADMICRSQNASLPSFHSTQEIKAFIHKIREEYYYALPQKKCNGPDNICNFAGYEPIGIYIGLQFKVNDLHPLAEFSLADGLIPCVHG